MAGPQADDASKHLGRKNGAPRARTPGGRTQKMKRFSKARMVDALRRHANEIEGKMRFDGRNGWTQLCPRNCPEPTVALIAKAVEYGGWREKLRIAEAVEDGSLGV